MASPKIKNLTNKITKLCAQTVRPRAEKRKKGEGGTMEEGE